MHRINTFLIAFVAGIFAVHAQVGIGTNSPEASSALDISSTEKGLLIPRMTTAQRTAIANPANSLLVFDTETNSYWSYIEDVWQESKPGVGKFVDGAADDIAYYEGRVGIGINAFSTAHRLYVENVKDDSSTNTSGVIRGVYNGDGNGGVTYGIVGVSRNNSTGSVPYAIGAQGIIENPNNGASMTTAVGSYPQVYNGGTVNYASSTITEVYNNAGTINTARGMDVGVINANGATLGTTSLTSFYATNNGSVTNDAYGIFIGGQGGGTVGGNSYALYLSTPYANVAGNAFALYSDNLNDSYIAGDVGIGTTDPQQKVHINGVMRLEPQDAAPTGGLGDLYVNSDGTLFFHDGSDWKAVQLAP